MKQCYRCKETKDESEFSKDTKRKDGLFPMCKTCSNLASKIYRKNNIDALKDSDKKYREEHKEDRRIAYSEWYQKNKQYHSEWRSRNKQSVSESLRRYRLNNKERRSEYNKKWLEKNIGYAREHRLNNAESYRTRLRNRRAMVKKSGGSHTAEDIHYLMKSQRGLCVVCFKKINDKYHVDHIIPIALGGTNDKYNIQLLCPKCNMEKHAKDPIRFMNEKGFLL